MTRVCPAVVVMLSSQHAHNAMHPRRAIDRTNGRSAEPVTVAEIRSETSKIKGMSRFREQQGHHQVALCFCAVLGNAVRCAIGSGTRTACAGQHRRNALATPNYSYEKRQRELAKKRKAEEKRQKKTTKGDDAPADRPDDRAPGTPGGTQSPPAPTE
jgi:hypothetical protein